MVLTGQTLENVEFAASLFRQAKKAIILTGAGISTPSGIPDFRSEGTGLWSQEEPLESASLNSFRTHPERFFKWLRPLASQIFNAQPNPAHLALAQMESRGRVVAIITQNIDMLHQKAGSQQVIEMHGSMATLSCTGCFQKYDYKDYLPAFLQTGALPYCNGCHSLLKPDVILFGEQLPQKAWYQAQAQARSCDLMMVVGSSLEVLPVAGLPMQAIDNGAHLIIINNTPTYLNVRADINILQDAAQIIPAIAERVV